MYDGMMHGAWMWFGTIVSVVFVLVLLVLLVLAAVWLYQQVSADDGPHGRAPDRDPVEILERRYAKGEIDREEYRRMKEEMG